MAKTYGQDSEPEKKNTSETDKGFDSAKPDVNAVVESSNSEYDTPNLNNANQKSDIKTCRRWINFLV